MQRRNVASLRTIIVCDANGHAPGVASKCDNESIKLLNLLIKKPRANQWRIPKSVLKRHIIGCVNAIANYVFVRHRLAKLQVHQNTQRFWTLE